MPNFNFISPPFSLVNFNESTTGRLDCDGPVSSVLPFADRNDLAFSVNIITDTESDADIVFAAPDDVVQFSIADENGSLVHNYTLDDNMFFEKYRTGIKQITYLWKMSLIGIFPFPPYINGLLPPGACFVIRLSASFNFGGTVVSKVALSNHFVKTESKQYTSLIEYFNDGDYAGFIYCNINNARNRTRLFLHAKQPKTIEDKAVYRRSNGVIKQRRSLLTKEYLVEGDHMPEVLHDRIAVALAHDNVQIESEVYTGLISKSAEYQIEWQDNLCLAPSNFRFLASPFALRNNNCNNC